MGIRWYDADVYGCYPIANEDWIVKVYFMEEDGVLIVRDNYYGLLKKDEYTELVCNIVRQWFPDESIKVFSNFISSYFPDEYISSTTLSENMARSPISLTSNIWVFVTQDNDINPEIFYSKCEMLVGSLKDASFHTSIAVYALHGNSIEHINKDNYSRYFLENNKSIDNGYLYEYRANVFDRK